jgi:hypothetical protein
MHSMQCQELAATPPGFKQVGWDLGDRQHRDINWYTIVAGCEANLLSCAASGPVPQQVSTGGEAVGAKASSGGFQ